jgi:hypothetical protein
MAALSNVFKYDAINLAIASGDTIKWAFYAAAATIDATTATYSATNEVTQPAATPALNAGGYTMAGRTLSASDGSVSTAYCDWDNLQMTPSGSSFQFQKVLIYNSTRSNRALWFHDYGSVQTWNAGTSYTLTIPDTGNGLVRVA